MTSTRERFYAAIAGSPTPTVAAGVVTAMHQANCLEIFQEVAELFQQGKINEYSLNALKEEYTA